MLFASDTLGVDSSGPQYLSPCQFTNAPTVQTNQTGFSSLQSHLPSRFFKSATQQPSPLFHSSLSTICVEKPSEPATPKVYSTQGKIARIFPTNSQSTSEPIKDILWDFDLCRTNSPNTGIHAFSEVSTQDFEALANIVENWSFPQRKPKLSYNPSGGLLLVEVTTAAHEFAITDFSRAVQPALDSLPINRQRLRIALEPNLLLRSTLTSFAATPDLALVSTSTGDTGRSSSRNVFAVVECAFSQDHGNLMQKIRDEVKAWPEIVLVVAIFVSEVRDYKSPPADSPTWNYFAQHESVLAPNHFLSLPPSIDESAACALVEYSPSDTANHDRSAISDSSGSDEDSDNDFKPLVLDPITIAGHTWCEIHDVQYCVWVQEDGSLDLDRDSTNGFLYPKIDMEGVEVAINDGLSAVKSEIDELAAKMTKPTRSSLRKLQDAELRVKFDWGAIQSAVKMAAEQTAVSRYEMWFLKSFRGTKRSYQDDESYHPSESQSGSSTTSEGGKRL